VKADWKKSTLGNVLSTLKNGLNCKQNKDGAGQKISRIESIATAYFDINRVGFSEISESDKAKFKLLKGDILFSHINSPIHVGKTATFNEDEDVYHGVNLLLMRPNEEVLPAYLELYLKSLFESGYWLKRCKQSVNQASVNQQDIAQVAIEFPSNVTEQHRIVTLLDEAFADIATAKANAEKNLQNARDLYRSFASDIFSSHAVSWPKRTLNQISTNLDNKRIPITKSDRQAGAYPYYGASGIVDYVAEYIFEGDTLLISEDGANLLARSTPIAFPASGRYWVNNHAHILKFEDVATQQFVELYLESIPLDEYITGAAQPKLNQKALNSIPIPIPDSKIEQQKIVNQLTAVQDLSEQLTFIQEQKLTALDDLKKSLLHQAFSGQL
jgi:type I restriction enzyme, S subunit